MAVVQPIAPSRQRGMSLIEVMIAMVVGLILLAGITLLVVNASRSNRDVDAAARQLENGRYASQVIGEHLRHAGFWGRLFPPEAQGMATTPAALPNACATPVTAAMLQSDMALHIQGEENPTGDPAAACIGDADHVDGTDIVTIRRAANVNHDVATANGAGSNQFYIQASITTFAIDTGDQAVDDPTNPTQHAFGVTELDRDGAGNVITVPAPLHQYRVDTFYISPSTRPANPCNADGSDPEAIPTLMHMRLNATGFCARPVAVGVENLQLEYGIDTSSIGASDAGTPNTFLTADAMTPGDWANVVGVRVYLLVRGTQDVNAVAGKQYRLGEASPITVADPGDGFSRHVFTTTTRLVNPAGRREAP